MPSKAQFYRDSWDDLDLDDKEDLSVDIVEDDVVMLGVFSSLFSEAHAARDINAQENIFGYGSLTSDVPAWENEDKSVDVFEGESSMQDTLSDLFTSLVTKMQFHCASRDDLDLDAKEDTNMDIFANDTFSSLSPETRAKPEEYKREEADLTILHNFIPNALKVVHSWPEIQEDKLRLKLNSNFGSGYGKNKAYIEPWRKDLMTQIIGILEKMKFKNFVAQKLLYHLKNKRFVGVYGGNEDFSSTQFTVRLRFESKIVKITCCPSNNKDELGSTSNTIKGRCSQTFKETEIKTCSCSTKPYESWSFIKVWTGSSNHLPVEEGCVTL